MTRVAQYPIQTTGAAALAAAMNRRDAGSGLVVCIGSGHNIAAERFEQLTRD